MDRITMHFLYYATMKVYTRKCNTILNILLCVNIGLTQEPESLSQGHEFHIFGGRLHGNHNHALFFLKYRLEQRKVFFKDINKFLIYGHTSPFLGSDLFTQNLFLLFKINNIHNQRRTTHNDIDLPFSFLLLL